MTDTRARKLKAELRVEELEQEVEALQDTLAHVVAVEAGCCSIPIDWREIGGVRVGLDAAGSAVRVELPDVLYGWDAE